MYPFTAVNITTNRQIGRCYGFENNKNLQYIPSIPSAVSLFLCIKKKYIYYHKIIDFFNTSMLNKINLVSTQFFFSQIFFNFNFSIIKSQRATNHHWIFSFSPLWCNLQKPSHVCLSLLLWGRGQPFLGITGFLFFQTELKPVRRVSAQST